MDIFMEYIIKRKKTSKDILAIIGIVFAGLLLSAVLLLFQGYLFGVAFILIGLIWYGAYILITNLNLEYEYIVTNTELDIDKIIAQRGRKRLITIDFKEVELCANIENPMFQSEYKNTSNIGKTISAFGDIKSGKVFFADFHQDGGRVRVLFEPTEKMIEGLKKVNPRNVHA